MIKFPNSAQKISLAVSGGMDSAVMMHMAAQHPKADQFIVFTLNHGLRPESANEVLSVKETAKSYGFDCIINHIKDLNKSNSIQEEARKARYQILAQAAKDHGCDMVSIAHHQDDICETLLSRLDHKSGLMGLAVMPSFFTHSGMIFHRPMLHLSQDDIEQYAHKYNVPILEDPSNQNPKYERVRHRHILKQNPDLKPPLLELHQKAKALKYDVTYQRDLFIQNHMILSPFGYCTFDHKAFAALDDVTALSVLKYGLTFTSGRPYIHVTKRPDKNMTLGGCYIHINKRHISIFREKRNLPLRDCDAGKHQYDHRFLLTLPEAGRLHTDLQKEYDIPHFAKQTLPILYGRSGKIYSFTDLNPTYQPQALEQFNSDPILHHWAISQPKWFSTK